MPELSNIVIVGGSLGGIRAASAFRRNGYSGAITFVGAEAHPPYDRPPLSKQILLGQWQPDRTFLITPDDFAKLEMDVRLGRRAVSLDGACRTITLDDGAVIPFDAAIVATGATPRSLPNTPPLEGIHTLRTMADSLAIRAAFDAGARVAVVGGGFIGAEVAAAARQRGLQVTLIEALSQPLERAVGPAVGAACAALHRERGVDLRLGIGVEGFNGSSRVEGVRLSDGTTVPADLVVVGIGVKPETDWLEGSGIELRDGVVCNEFLETRVPGVYAIGDVCRWPNQLFGEEMRVEHWTNAVEQAMAVSRNILGGPEKAKPYAAVPYVWSDQYDLGIQYVGRARPDDELVIKHGTLESRQFVGLYGRGGWLLGAVGFNMHRVLTDYRRLIAQRASLEDAIAHQPELDDD